MQTIIPPLPPTEREPTMAERERLHFQSLAVAEARHRHIERFRQPVRRVLSWIRR